MVQPAAREQGLQLEGFERHYGPRAGCCCVDRGRVGGYAAPKRAEIEVGVTDDDELAKVSEPAPVPRVCSKQKALSFPDLAKEQWKAPQRSHYDAPDPDPDPGPRA
ncbi:hypothetical protein ANO11243_053850 [Dothideomycetidae sp. 11243]|nr:hypothetical protein ANO11243_053850 [fungal sp. No.11243]